MLMENMGRKKTVQKLGGVGGGVNSLGRVASSYKSHVVVGKSRHNRNKATFSWVAASSQNTTTSNAKKKSPTRLEKGIRQQSLKNTKTRSRKPWMLANAQQKQKVFVI